MLHFLRKQRHGFGRGMAYMLVAVWMSLALQPCAMAGMQAMDALPCAACPEQGSMSQTPCQDMANCASMVDRRAMDATVFAHSLSAAAQPALISWVPAYAVPEVAQRIAFNVSNHPAEPPPLLRFCILQI